MIREAAAVGVEVIAGAGAMAGVSAGAEVLALEDAGGEVGRGLLLILRILPGRGRTLAQGQGPTRAQSRVRARGRGHRTSASLGEHALSPARARAHDLAQSR